MESAAASPEKCFHPCADWKSWKPPLWKYFCWEKGWRNPMSYFLSVLIEKVGVSDNLVNGILRGLQRDDLQTVNISKKPQTYYCVSLSGPPSFPKDCTWSSWIFLRFLKPNRKSLRAEQGRRMVGAAISALAQVRTHCCCITHQWLQQFVPVWNISLKPWQYGAITGVVVGRRMPQSHLCLRHWCLKISSSSSSVIRFTRLEPYEKGLQD